MCVGEGEGTVLQSGSCGQIAQAFWDDNRISTNATEVTTEITLGGQQVGADGRMSWTRASVVYTEKAEGATEQDRATCEPSSRRATGILVRVVQ